MQTRIRSAELNVQAYAHVCMHLLKAQGASWELWKLCWKNDQKGEVQPTRVPLYTRHISTYQLFEWNLAGTAIVRNLRGGINCHSPHVLEKHTN